MKAFFVKEIKDDWFFFIVAFASYLTGSFLSKAAVKNWDFVAFFAGIILFYAMHIAQRYSQMLGNKNRSRPYRKGESSHKAQHYLPLLVLLAIILTCSYFLLQREVLIGINLIWIGLIFLLTFIQTNNQIIHISELIDWLIKSLIISPLLLHFGVSLQAVPISSEHYLLAMPLFFLSGASFVALEFPMYAKRPEERKSTLIPKTGIHQTIVLHNILILLSYLSLGAYLYFSGSFRGQWTLLLITLISLVEMYQLHRLSLGMKPNYRLIKATAYLQTLSFIYLFVFNTLI